MKLKNIYAVIFIFLILTSSTLILLKSDEVFKKQPIYKIPSRLTIRDVDVKPINITGSHVELNVTTYIDNYGGKPVNPYMLIRAINSNNRLVYTKVITQIPNVLRGETKNVSSIVKLERKGNYELNILIFDNKSIVDTGSVEIRGLESLIPFSKISGIEMTNIDFNVNDTKNGRVGIKCDVYLENKFDKDSENLKLIIKAKEASSGIVADEKSIETGIIPKEGTVVKTVKLEVPDKYNYFIYVEAWKKDILINTWEKSLRLTTTKIMPSKTKEKKTYIDVSKFVREKGTWSPVPTYATGREAQREKGFIGYSSDSGNVASPGFESITTIIVFSLLLLLKRRFK